MASSLPMIFVIGVGRSGTNFLADALGTDPALVNTVENRYVWNYRQRSFEHDLRDPAEATLPVARYIARHFEGIAARTGRRPVDKTPSNVFRLGFAARVFPEARFIHIIRDGRENVFSRLREWHGGNAVVDRQQRGGEVETVARYRRALLGRRVERLRDILASDSLPRDRIPAFLADNAATFARQVLRRSPVRYGERFPGMAGHLAAHGLVATAAAQWREGVMQALTEGRRLAPGRYLELRYEALLDDPQDEWRRVAAFLDLDAEGPARRHLVERGERRARFDWRDPEHRSFLDTIEPHARPTLEFLGYGWE